MRIALFLAAVILTMQSGCSHSKTYVLFAGNAQEDKDMDRVPTVRMRLSEQPPGATIFCGTATQKMSVTRYDDDHVKIHRFDGSDPVVTVPDDEGMPAGLAVLWPAGTVKLKCGLDPSSPLGSHAYVEWGTFTLMMRRDAPDAVTYVAGSEELKLHLPLTDADRANLHAHAVPQEITDMLY